MLLSDNSPNRGSVDRRTVLRGAGTLGTAGVSGLAEVVRLVLRTETQWTNGTAGLYGIPWLCADWPLVGTVTGRTAEAALNFLVVLVAVAGVWVVLRRVHRSPWGRVQRLVRSDPDLAAALGKDTYRLRMQSSSSAAS